MRTKRIKLFTFDELSEQAKQVVIDNYKSEYREYSWTDEWVETIKNGLEAFNHKLGRYQFDYHSISQSHFEIQLDKYFSYDDMQHLTGVRLRTWILNNFEGVLYENKETWYINVDGKLLINTIGVGAKKRRSKVNVVERDCPFTGYTGDNDFLEPIFEFLKKPYEITFQDILTKCVDNTLKGLVADCAYQDSDEYISEELSNLDEEYTADGKLFN